MSPDTKYRIIVTDPPPRLPEDAFRCCKRVKDALPPCPTHPSFTPGCEFCIPGISLDTLMAMLHAALYFPRPEANQVETLREALRILHDRATHQYIDWMHFHEVAMSDPFKAESMAQAFASEIATFAVELIERRDGRSVVPGGLRELSSPVNDPAKRASLLPRPPLLR